MPLHAASVVLAVPVMLAVSRRGRSLALSTAGALLLWLDLWWVLPLANVNPPSETLPLLLLWPRSTAVMVSGHLVVLLLLLAAAGLFAPRAGSSGALARRAASRGDHLAAGEFWLQAGRQRRALRAFLRARAWGRAAELARSRGNLRRAAELFEREGGTALATAAQLYSRLGLESQARMAALHFAQHTVESGAPELAVEPFLRAGDARRAVTAVELAMQGGRLTPAFADIALRAAREARRLPLAARVARATGRHREAGDLFLAVGEPLDAARMFERSGDTLRAAEALRLAGREDRAATLRAAQLAESGQLDLAAEEYEAAGLLGKAAETLARLGRYAEAIERYRQAGLPREAAALSLEHGDPRDAAALYTELGDWGEAGVAWERAGDLHQAAVCFERSGDYGRALECLGRAGLVADQARLLARIGRVEEGFMLLFRRGDLRAAWDLLSAFGGTFPTLVQPLQQLAAWLHGQGETTAAVGAIQRATAGIPVTRELLAAHCQLAELLETRGDLRGAEAALQRVVDFDYAFRDAAGRLARLAEERRAEDARRAAAHLAQASSGPAPAVDESADRYVLEQELGRGGMGVVYRARDTRLGRTVAIKVLEPRQLSAEALRRFEREARAAAALSHPGIVHIYDFDRGFGSYFISMEYVAGPTTSQLLRSEPEFIARNLLSLMRQICDAVGFAHAHQVVHRDLKPSNMVLAERRQVKILDFGIARRLDDLEITGSGVTGTPYYMSPEQILGEEPGERSDVYSLGVTFFQMATGSLPFSSGNVLRAHLELPPPDPQGLNPRLEPGLGHLIQQCLEKEPRRRPANGAALLAALDALSGSAGS